MNKTAIEWVKNPDGTPGYTWNPITGCLNHQDGLCKGGGFPCYAYRLANTRLKEVYLENNNTAYVPSNILMAFNEHPELNPFYPRFWEDRIEELITRNEYLDGDLPLPTKRRGIFVCDMSDLFGVGIPEEWTRRVLDTIDWNKGYDRFYLLTKQPQNLIKFSPFPDNCWVGVSVTANAYMTLAMTNLVNVDAPVRFISFEPLLGSIGLSDHMSMKNEIDWVIIGAQTKPYKPPKIEWIEEIVKACDKAGIPVFLKDSLKPLLPISPGLFYIYDEYKGLLLRQEMPSA